MEGAKDVVDAINGLREDLDQRHSDNVSAQAATDAKVVEAIRRIDDLHKAFPGGDWEAHRRYHETLIKKNEERSKFYADLRQEMAQKGLWALVIGAATAAYWLGNLVWLYLKTKVSS